MVRVINIDTKTRTIRVSNGKDDLEWFTTDTGSHVPLKKGQSKAEAIKEHFGDKKDKVSGKAIAAAKKEMLARQAKERKALRDSSSRLGESYYKQRVNELIKQQEIEEQDFYEGHGIKAPKAKQQPAGQAKGTDENGTVWINVGGTIIPLRVRDNSGIDPKILATPEEIKRGRAKYEGIKDRQDAAREKAKSGRTYADVIDEENWEELSRKYLRDFGGGKKLNHVELNSLMNGDKLNIIEKRKVREAMRKIGGLEE